MPVSTHGLGSGAMRYSVRVYFSSPAGLRLAVGGCTTLPAANAAS